MWCLPRAIHKGLRDYWTSAQLAFYRDRALPLTLSRLQSRIQALSIFAAKRDENLRAAQPVLTAFLTSYKLAAGKLIGLRDDRLIARGPVVLPVRSCEKSPVRSAGDGNVPTPL